MSKLAALENAQFFRDDVARVPSDNGHITEMEKQFAA